MSKKVDNRAVEMSFDNKQFEKGIKESVNSLDNLKKALKLDSAAKSFDAIDKSAKNVSFAAMEKGINAIADRFSVMGIVGMTVIQNLTSAAMQAAANIARALTSAITSGGKARSQNIAQAKFQIEGLGYAWKDVEEDINYGVKDTAYGLDVAAKAAGQLLASNVATGDSMKTALRAISGVAAMTGASYDDIADVFLTVAGNGRLMGSELTRLSYRGINAAAVLAKAFNTTEEEVRDMTSKGKISFAEFAKAMDDAYGAHAKEANKTFSGALSNMKAALSRIGAKFYTPAFEVLRNVINALIPVIDAASASLNPFFSLLTATMRQLSWFAIDVIGKINLDKPIRNITFVLSALIKGFKNVVSTLTPVFKAIGEAFAEIFPPITTNNVLDFAAAILTMSQNFKIGEAAVEDIKRTFKGLFALVSIGAKVVGALLKVIGGIASALAPFARALLSITARIGDFLVELDSAANKLDVLKQVFDKVSSVFKTISSAIGQAIQFVVSNLDKFGVALGAVGSGMILYKIYSAIKNFIDGLKGIGKEGIVGRVKETLSGLKDTLSDFQQSIKVGQLVAIAASVGILAMALAKLSEIDPEKLMTGLTAMAGLFAELVGSFAAFSFILDKKNVSGIFSLSIALIAIASAVAILTKSVEKLGGMDFESLAKGLGGAVALCVALAAVMKIGNFNKVGIRQAIGILAFAEALVILSKAVSELGSLSLESLAKGLGSVVILMGAILGFFKLFEKVDNKGLVKVAVSMFIIGKALEVLSSVISTLGSLSMESIGKGLLGIAGALMILIVAMGLMPNNMTGSAAAILVLSIAVKAMSGALQTFGEMSFEQIGKSLFMLAGAFTIFAMAMAGMRTALPGAAAMLVISAALAVLTPSLLILGSMSLESIGQSLIAIAGAFAVFGIAAAILGPMIPTMLGLAGSIALLGVGLAGIGAGVLLFSAGIAALAASGAAGIQAITFFIESLLGLIPVLAKGIGEGIIAIIDVIASSADSIISLVTTLLQSILTALTTVIPQLIDVIVLFISELLTAVQELVPQLIETGMLILTSFLQGIRDNIFQIVVLAGEIVVNFLNGLATQLPAIIQAGFNLMISFLNGLADGIRNNMGLVMSAVGNVLTAIVESAWSFLTSTIGGFLSKGGDIINGVIDGIRNGLAGIKDGFSSVIQAGVDTVKGFVDSFFSAAGDLIGGIVDGIKGGISRVGEAIGSVAESAVGVFKGLLGIASPSKVFKRFGRFVVEGFVVGIDKFAHKVGPAVSGFVNKTESAAKTAIAALASVFDEDVEFDDPTIKPVIDMTDIDKGIKSLDSKFANVKSTFGLGGAIDNLTIIANNTRKNQEAATAPVESSKTVVNNYEFNQTNNSPKPLSRAEIYRQTKNQISRFKEATATS